mgnify:CR=1 FL=1
MCVNDGRGMLPYVVIAQLEIACACSMELFVEKKLCEVCKMSQERLNHGNFMHLNKM